VRPKRRAKPRPRKMWEATHVSAPRPGSQQSRHHHRLPAKHPCSRCRPNGFDSRITSFKSLRSFWSEQFESWTKPEMTAEQTSSGPSSLATRPPDACVGRDHDSLPSAEGRSSAPAAAAEGRKEGVGAASTQSSTWLHVLHVGPWQAKPPNA
jgi:hypothetical protein